MVTYSESSTHLSDKTNKKSWVRSIAGWLKNLTITA